MAVGETRQCSRCATTRRFVWEESAAVRKFSTPSRWSPRSLVRRSHRLAIEEACMKSGPLVWCGAAAMAIVVSVTVLSQTAGRRDFDAEYRAAVQAAKDAAGFEWLGTLVRTCVLPQSGGENTSDTIPDFVAD